MDSQPIILAIDLGASSGRVLGFQFFTSNGTVNEIRMSEVHRFPNYGVTMGNHLMWNLPGLWYEIKTGLSLAVRQFSADAIQSLGVDTWGVDFALLSNSDELLSLPYHYRDSQNVGMMDEAFATVSQAEIYQHSGLQLMQINSLYQLLAIKKRRPELLEQAKHFLMMPDLFHWLLTGKISHEKTDSSTTQLYDPKTQTWSEELISAFGLKREIFGEISEPGETLGSTLSSIQSETGLSNKTQVIIPGSHDTASAVLAVPVNGKTGQTDWCYISSGTWSLMGVETNCPIITDQSLEMNFTNEAGVYGTNRVLKNIGGLWLLQECLRIWNRDGEDYSFQDLVELAANEEEGLGVINPDDPTLAAPENMPAAIVSLAAEQGVQLGSHGQITRCAMDSLAVRYAEVLKMLETLVGNRIETIHVVGGGSQNELLCQLTANACQRTVVAGPVEATAIGNALVQAISLGIVADLEAARGLVHQLEGTRSFEPQTSPLATLAERRAQQL